MNDEILRLQSKILELEELLEDKEIMINLLLKEIKNLKSNKTKLLNGHIDNVVEINTKRVKITESSSCTAVPVKEDDNKLKSDSVACTTNDSLPHIAPEICWVYKYKLKEDLEVLLNKKKVVRLFKDNVYFDEFMDFCSDTYVINSFEVTKVSHGKNVKKYLQENKTHILKYLILNINKIHFTSVCSTLLALSTEFTDLEKCVIIHDLILYLQDFSKLVFYAFCIFNKELKSDLNILKMTLHMILSFQYKIDLEIHKNKKIIITSLNNLKSIFNFQKQVILEDYLLKIKSDIEIIVKGKINPAIYEYIYSVRALGHFLDWDYVYNIFISENLIQNITGCKILYMGILALNSIRIFGETESADIIINFIKDKMVEVDEIGIASFLVVKQLNEKDSLGFLEANEDNLMKKGYDIEYLKKVLIY